MSLIIYHRIFISQRKISGIDTRKGKNNGNEISLNFQCLYLRPVPQRACNYSCIITSLAIHQVSEYGHEHIFIVK